MKIIKSFIISLKYLVIMDIKYTLEKEIKTFHLQRNNK